MTPFIAEIVGTFILMVLGNGVVCNVVLKGTKGNNSGWIVITTGWAMAVYVAVLIAGPYSGAHINPAVTVALAIAGLFEWSQVPIYIAGQFIGAMAAMVALWITHKDHYDATEDSASIHATFCNTPAIANNFRNLMTEILGTFILVFAVFYIVGPELSVGEQEGIIGLGSLGAIPVAFIVWSVGISLGGPTGYAINPARDLGPRIMHAILPLKNKGDSGWGYSWIPVVGPLIGGAIAALLYLAMQ